MHFNILSIFFFVYFVQFGSSGRRTGELACCFVHSLCTLFYEHSERQCSSSILQFHKGRENGCVCPDGLGN